MFIILDIDGVIATPWSLEQPRKEWFVLNEKPTRPFFPPAVENLNYTLKETGADIVLSSNWRLNFSLEEMQVVFRENSVIKAPIAMTGHMYDDFANVKAHSLKDLLKSERDIEIRDYVEENNLKNFIIIDDRPLIVFKNRFIRTDSQIGLTKEDAQRAVALLKL